MLAILLQGGSDTWGGYKSPSTYAASTLFDLDDYSACIFWEQIVSCTIVSRSQLWKQPLHKLFGIDVLPLRQSRSNGCTICVDTSSSFSFGERGNVFVVPRRGQEGFDYLVTINDREQNLKSLW